jgi:cysteine desulfurase
MRRVYMDANATTPLVPEVFEAMRPYYIERFGNASSIHQTGQQARAAVDQARESVAALIGARSSEVVFTSGGTESDNLALFGAGGAGSLSAGDHLLVSAIEHSAVLHAAQELEKRGVEVTLIGCDAASRVSADAVRAAMRPNTKLVSIMLANNETGVLQPVAEFAEIAHRHEALFHTDAVQAAGKIPINVAALDCDLLSVSAHKIYGPQGIGALFVRRNVRVAPLFYGGTHERQRRAGTENVPGIVGFGKAAELAQQWMADGGAMALATERDRLEAGILAAVAETGVNGAGAERVANTTNLYFDHVEAEALLIALDLKGLAVSGGSACQSGATEPSHVLLAMGLSPARARASLRFSLSRLTTKEDVEFALDVVPAAVARLRELSPSYTGAMQKR